LLTGGDLMSSIYSVYINLENSELKEKIDSLLIKNEIEVETEDIFNSDFAIVREPLRFSFPHILITKSISNIDYKNIIKNELIDFILEDYPQELAELKIQNATYFVMARGSRGAFKQRIIQECEKLKRAGGTFSLALISVMNFYKLENSFSTVAIDEISKELLTMMRLSVRKSDEAMKISRREYGVILPFTELRNAEIACERVKRRTNKIGNYPDIDLAFGITEVSNPNEDIIKILERLKRALYISEANNGEISFQ